ncbi:3-5 exonuclease, putative (ISS)-like protein [Cricetulus griseus]|nr:3-5 exonuclease, putative (ISS)-like protein [Cricetulus griseus]
MTVRHNCSWQHQLCQRGRWASKKLFMELAFNMLGADGHDDLANVNPGHCALGLPKGTTHTHLEPVSSSTGQHLIDSDDVERVEPY